MIAERVERLDQGMVSRYLRAIHEKIEAEPKIRKWFQDLTQLSSQVKMDPHNSVDPKI